MKNDYQTIEAQRKGSVVQINLNRPAQHNALIPQLLGELDQALDEIALMKELQFVVLSGNGRSFCAGADLNWFLTAQECSPEQNALQYKILPDLLLKLFQLPQVTIAAVYGNVFGGGIGLMAVCDFVVADPTTKFMFSEVKLGLIPATILPFVAKRLSLQFQRKWILTGILFSALEAYQAGLVDVVTENSPMETSVNEFINSFEAASPSAVRNAKALINQVASGQVTIHDTDVTSTILAQSLLSPEGHEGIKAFLEMRKPRESRK